jgi:ribosome-associated protein
MEKETIFIRRGLTIPGEELIFTASRSSGPGGQNVNKVSTRVTLWFDVAGSPSLPEAVKARLLAKLATRINKEGLLYLTARESRSQAHNRELARQRFVELLQGALYQPRVRKKTAVPRSATRERLEAKRRRSRLKKGRGGVAGEELG